MRIALPAALLTALPLVAALGQAVGVPPIEQEPRPGAVERGEAARGLTLSPQQNRQQQGTVDQLYRDLTGQSPSAMPPLAAPTGPSPRQEARDEDRLYRELTGQNPGAPGAAPPMGPPMRSQAREEDRLYRDLTGQNPGGAPSAR